MVGGKYRAGNVCSFIVSKGCFCHCTWMRSKWLEGSNISIPCGGSDGTRRSGGFLRRFLITCAWRALNANVNLTEVCLANAECSNRESLQEQLKNHPNEPRMVQTLLRGPTEGQRRNALKGPANWPTKQLSKCLKVSTPCHDDQQFKKRRIGNGGRSVKSLLSNRLEMLVFGTHCRPVILCRRVTTWTGASDRRLARSISYIHNTSDFEQYSHVVKYNTALQIGIVVPRF